MRRHRCEFGGSPLERGFGALTTLGGLVAMLWAATTFTPGVRLLDDIVPIGLVAIATWYAWRNLVRPRVTITDSEITVLNGVRVYNVPIGQIAEVTATSRGIAIRTEEGDRIEPVVAGASVLSS